MAGPARAIRGLLTVCVTALVLFVAPAAQAVTQSRSEQRTARYLESVRGNQLELHAFLLALPKGGDLHNHLSGAVPTETLIRFAVEDRLCIDTTTLAATPAPMSAGGSPGLLVPGLLATPAPPATCPAGQRPAADSASDPAFFQQIVRAWSMEGFQPGVETGHDHFFATFGKFGLATSRKGDMLAAVATINAQQNVLYLETLASRQGTAVKALAKTVGFDPDFAAMRNKLLAGGMAQIVSAASSETDADVARFNDLLGCHTPQPQPACVLTVRYDYQVGRATDPAAVFTNLLLGFELQRSDRRYVGVNLVQPEDDPVAVRDYTLQMRMIEYLHTVYPGAHVTLHAGELVPGIVAPAALTFHVRQAVEIAGAERIGHGVDLVNETNYPGLLREMAHRHVLVEVPLTSNAQILGVSGAAHPFPRYRAAGVPVALATDDPAVSRIDITHEYQLATTEYHLHYRDLKTLVRASLEHAFLPGRSIWLAPDRFQPTGACAHDLLVAPAPPRRRCLVLLHASAKAAVEWQQEARFNMFERQHARP